MMSMSLGGALFVTGGLGMSGVLADGEPGSGFGSLSLVGVSSSMRLVGLNADGKEGEGQVPYSSANISLGPYGHALSSVFWPGGTAGNAGSTLGLLGNPACSTASIVHPVPGCPDIPKTIQQKYPALNDSVKVEAQTDSGDPSQTIDQGDGAVHMSAIATPADVTTDAGVAGSYVEGVGTFGQSNSAARMQLTGVKAGVSDASSQVKDVNIGGVIKIGSVKSLAHAVTDGTKSSGSSSTVVSNFTIAGVPMTVDEKGVRVQNAGGSPKPANDAVNKVIANFMFQAYLTQPTHTTKAGDTTYNSGSLILAFNEPNYNKGANNDGQVLVLGGATVTAAASPGYLFVPPPFITPPTGTVIPPTTTVPGTSLTGTGVPSGLTGGTTLPPVTANSLPPAQLASQPLKFPGGLSPAWIVAVLVGTAFMAAGFRRLPDRVLESTGVTCPLEED
jgi:hypothetical protein